MLVLLANHPVRLAKVVQLIVLLVLEGSLERIGNAETILTLVFLLF